MQCGLAFGRPARQRFRRTVTILFADLVGSTALGERLDPEALTALLTTYFETARTIIEGHGGSVVKYVGDAVMAVFGLPVAHEDDAMRAVRAAFDVQQSIGRLNPELSVSYGVTIAARMGVHTGEIAGEGPVDENLVFGDTANTAARLEQNAGPGEVLISRATHGLVRDQVVVEPLPAMAVKGKAEPVSPLRLVSVPRVRPPHTQVRPPMIGRDAELAELIDRFHMSLVHRGFDAVSIVGEAGVGKSRLLAAFTEAVAGEATVLNGRCLPYGDGITYWPVLEIIQQAAGIEHDDPSVVAVEKLHQLATNDEERRAVEWVGQAVGLTEAAATSEAIAWASVTLLRRWARSGPIVLALEDLHWATETLLSLVELVVHALVDEPVFVVGSFRPELLEARPVRDGVIGWPSLHLHPLAEPDARHLITSLLGVPPDAPLEAQLMAASGGNPFYLAQMSSMLVEDDLVEIIGGQTVATLAAATPVPPSIHALLTARIDGLPEEEATALCRAAVWGEEFDLSDLVDLLPQHLRPDVERLTDALCSRGLLVRSGPRDTTMSFEHLLVRDVAYEQLTKETRAELHGAAARRIEAWVDEGGAQYDAIIGNHLELSYRYQTDIRSSTTVDPASAAAAAKYLLRAGRRALLRQDATAACSLLIRVVGLLSVDDGSRARVEVELGEALLASGRLRDAERQFSQVTSGAAASSDTKSLAELCLTEVHMQMSPPDVDGTLHVQQDAQRAMLRFAGLGDDHAVNRAAWLTFMTAMKLGQIEVARNAIDQLSAVADRTGELGNGRLAAAWAMTEAWGPTPVPAALAATASILEQVHGDPSAEPLVLSVHAFLLALEGEILAARQMLSRQRELLENSGQRMLLWASWGQATGRVELSVGDPARAEGPLRESYVALTEVGERGFASTVAGQLAHALIELGRHDDASEFVEACKVAAQGDVLSEILWRTASARVLANRGESDEAVALAETAVAIAFDTEWPNVQGDALLDQTRVLHRCGRDHAGEPAAAALSVYRQKQNRVGTTRAGRLLEELGRPESH
jgi:class 3 adenylate cyclase/tetratricopeptide (TPR) repeat protein